MAQILGTGKQRSGKNSRISINTVSILSFAEWNVDEQGENLDTTNFDSGGYTEGIFGPLTLNHRGGGDWDAGENPYDNPPGLYVRDDLPALRYFINTTDNIFWYLPYARISGSTNSTQVKGKVAFNFSGNNQGTYTRPTGSV